MPTQPPLRAGCPIPSQTAGSSQAPSVPSQRCGNGSASAHPHSAPIPPWCPHPLQPSRPTGVGTPPTPHDPGGLSLSSGRLQPLTIPEVSPCPRDASSPSRPPEVSPRSRDASIPSQPPKLPSRTLTLPAPHTPAQPRAAGHRPRPLPAPAQPRRACAAPPAL